MTQWFRALVSPAESLSSTSSTRMVAHNHSLFSPVLQGMGQDWGTCTQTVRNTNYYKIKINL